MHIDSIIDAIKLIDKVNKMPFDDLVNLIESQTHKRFNKQDLEDWKFSGLNNKDFIIIHMIEQF